MSASEEFVFVCPSCGESMEVNPAMKDALVDNGCVVCGSSVSAAAFSATRESTDE